jgi:hypothetical protein
MKRIANVRTFMSNRAHGDRPTRRLLGQADLAKARPRRKASRARARCAFGLRKLVGQSAADLTFATPRGAFDIAHIFETSASALQREIETLAKKLPATGTIWVSWPKKSAKVATDITEDTVRTIALPLGLVDVKVCAIDATWSGLKLVWRRENRAGRS